MSATTARPPSDPLDGLCMLTAVLRRCSSVRLSTAVQGEIPSTMHDLVMWIAAAHWPACAGSLETCGSYAIERESVATAHRRVRPWCREARRDLSCDANDRYRTVVWLRAAHVRWPEYQSRGSSRLQRCGRTYNDKLTHVLQKRYFVLTLCVTYIIHLQIVCK